MCLDASIRKAAIAADDSRIIGLGGRQKPPKQMLLLCALKTLRTLLNLYRCQADGGWDCVLAIGGNEYCTLPIKNSLDTR